MSAVLRARPADYLAIRRALGFKLERDGKLLTQFIDYLDRQDTDTLTVEHAVAWATSPIDAGRGWTGARFSVVRSFATHLHSLDASVPIPPTGLLPCGTRRAIPFLYTDTDIAALTGQCARLRRPIGRLAYPVLIRLLAVTGMRIGEALKLDDSDLDAERGILTVRHAKNDKMRLVPLHPTTLAALRDYQRQRDLLFPHPATPALFIASTAGRIAYVNFSQIFVKLARRADLDPGPAGCRPRPHDLRHTFAVRTLIDWYTDGGDVQARLPLLSTYLGHSEPKHTYWYLHAAPELLALAAARLESSLRRQP
jgi:integrase/recombinase XerD